ncbi:DUF6728 family protein [Filimonas effusa]|uniref:DUF2970 domain-containing protein n=1 Tax=Filimonas effusa TaxID=2508721 RepID=A0A4Q1DCQ2_9BACT|nr:hypothetical protein ESB13_10755 [Filimonas effusa]
MSIFWRQVAEYLYLRKRDPKAPRNTNMRLMHGMNRISIIVFLLAVLIMIIRFLILPLFR